ncbi:hypothetical protein HK101_012039, partial [Irineochytrium annulatum]
MSGGWGFGRKPTNPPAAAASAPAPLMNIDFEFRKFLNEMNFEGDTKDRMMALPDKEKQILIQNHKTKKASAPAATSPQPAASRPATVTQAPAATQRPSQISPPASPSNPNYYAPQSQTPYYPQQQPQQPQQPMYTPQGYQQAPQRPYAQQQPQQYVQQAPYGQPLYPNTQNYAQPPTYRPSTYGGQSQPAYGQPQVYAQTPQPSSAGPYQQQTYVHQPQYAQQPYGAPTYQQQQQPNYQTPPNATNFQNPPSRTESYQGPPRTEVHQQGPPRAESYHGPAPAQHQQQQQQPNQYATPPNWPAGGAPLPQRSSTGAVTGHTPSLSFSVPFDGSAGASRTSTTASSASVDSGKGGGGVGRVTSVGSVGAGGPGLAFAVPFDGGAKRTSTGASAASGVSAGSFDLGHDLHSAFERVMDALGIKGHARESTVAKTTDAQKRAVVDQYVRKQIQENPTFLDHLSGRELDQELEEALDDLGIPSSARANMLRNMPDASKRLLLKQYLKKKGGIPRLLHFSGQYFGQTVHSHTTPAPVVAPVVTKPLPAEPDPSTMWQQTPEYFIRQLADRTNTLKQLNRILASLGINLSLATPADVEAFVHCEVLLGSQKVRGVQSLEIAMHRITQSKALATSSSATASATYADSVLEDELRNEALNCAQIIMNSEEGVAAVLETPGLINQICYGLSAPIALFGSRDTRRRAASLNLRINSIKALGVLDVEQGFPLMKSALMELSIMQNEPAPLHFLVLFVVRAFPNISSTVPRPASNPEDEDVQAGLDDADLIWDLRGAIIGFIVFLLSDIPETADRLALRSELESRGWRRALECLALWNPPGDILEFVEVYDEDKAADIEEMEMMFREMNESLRDPHDTLTAMLEKARSLPEPERCTNATVKSLSHMCDLVTSVATQSARDEWPATGLAGEETVLAMTLMEKLSAALAGAVGGWGKSTGKVENKRNRMQALALEMIRTIEAACGMPLNLAYGHGGGSVRGERSTAAGPASAKELESVKALYNEALASNDDLRAENESLRQRLKSSGTEEAAKSESIQKELRDLQEAVATLTRERDELKEKLNPTKKEEEKASKTKAHHFIDVAAPLPEINIPKSDVAMKPLNWVKVPNRLIHKSVWMSVVEGAYLGPPMVSEQVLDRPELESLPNLFGKPSDANTPQSPVLGKRRVVITLIDMTRARNMEILLGSVRISHGAIRDAVMEVKDEVLTAQRLRILQQCVPTDEEVEIVRAFEGDRTQLGNAERFILTMSTVPRLPQRIDALLYRQRFHEEMDELTPDIAAVSAAIEAVRRSPALLRLLQTVLVVGNYLNGGGFRGKAYGFLVEGLSRLKETRANEEYEGRARAPTLLHYVARRVEETDEEWKALREELKPVEVACRVSIADLFTSVKAMGAGVEAIRAELAEVESSSKESTETDWFKDVMTSFVASAAVRVQDVTKKAEALEEEVKQLMAFFGEEVEKRDAPFEEFFRALWEFVEALEVGFAWFDNDKDAVTDATFFQRAYKENLDAEENAKKRGLSTSILTRRPGPTPLQLALMKKKNRLKAVEGQEAFTKRLTVRRGKLATYDDDKETIKSMINTRKTIRRAATKAPPKGSAKDLFADGEDAKGELPAAAAPMALDPNSAVPLEIQQLLSEAQQWD